MAPQLVIVERANLGQNDRMGTSKISIFVYTLVMFAGDYGLDRINPDFASFGEFQYIRTWLAILIFPLIAMRLVETKYSNTHYGTARGWAVTIIALHIYLALSALWSPQSSLSLQQISSVLLIGLLIIIATILFSRSSYRNIDLFLFIVLCFASVYAIGGISGYGIWRSGNGRMAAFGGGPNIFVRIMSMGLFISLYYWTKTRSWYYILPMPLLLICAILSGSRGGMIALVATFPIFILLALPKRGLISYTPFLITVGLFGLIYPLLSKTEVWQKIVGGRFATATVEQSYGLDERLGLFQEAWRMFLDHPIIGIGLDGFAQTNINGKPYVHNLILQIAAEGGVLALFMLAVAILILISHSLCGKDFRQMTVLFMGTYHLLASMWSGSYSDARWIWIFFLIYLLPSADAPSKTSRTVHIKGMKHDQSGYSGSVPRLP